MILDFFVFCDAWCWLTFVTPSQGWLFQQKPPAKGSSCSEVFLGEEHRVRWASIPLTFCSASCWQHLQDRKRPQETPRLCLSPHTAVHIQAITVNGVLISQTDVSGGWNDAEKLTRIKPALLASWSWGDGAKLQWFCEAQLPGPLWYKKDVGGRHGFPAEGCFIFSRILPLSDLLGCD